VEGPLAVSVCICALAHSSIHTEEHIMKLNSALVERTLSEFDAQAIPENHPVIPQLNQVFGEHTFFLNGSGLHVVEPAGTPEAPEEAGKVIKLATWTDANRSSLAPHDPRPTGQVIPFKPAEPKAVN
jgi:hypothetical protein